MEETSLEGNSSRENDEELSAAIQSAQLQVRSGHAILTPNAEAASRAFLAYYIANDSGEGPKQILSYAEDFALGAGLVEMPPMEAKVVARLGLEGMLKAQ